MSISYIVEVPRTAEIGDMIRRDRASPVGEYDVALIKRLADGKPYDRVDLPKKVFINLTTKERYGPLVKRWESFGCRVVNCSDPTVVLSNSSRGGDKIVRSELEMNEEWATNHPQMFRNSFFRFIHEHDGEKISVHLSSKNTIILAAEPKTEMEWEAEIS